MDVLLFSARSPISLRLLVLYCVVNIQFDLRLLALLNWYCAPGGDPGAPLAATLVATLVLYPPGGFPPLVATLAPTLVPPWRHVVNIHCNLQAATVVG